MDVHDNDETWDTEINDNIVGRSVSDSSSEELDGAHTILPIRAQEQEDDETMDVELPEAFPRYEYNIFKDGLNKYPAWTVFPNHLAKCLGAAAAIVKAGEEMTSPDVQRLKTLYQQLAVDAFEKCLQERALREWPVTVQENIYAAIEQLLDLLVAKLPQLELEGGGAEEDLHPLLQCLSMSFDRHCEYHLKHRYDGAEDFLKKRKSNASLGMNEASTRAQPLVASPEKTHNYDWFCHARADYVTEVNECTCAACYPGVSHVLLATLLNRFGESKYGDGYAEILKLLCKAAQLLLSTIERLLEPLALAAEFFTQGLLQKFAEPCRNLLEYIAELLDHDLDTFSDKTKQGSYASVSQILRHLRGVFGMLMSSEAVEQLVSPVQRKLVERMLGYQSFNKQLSAVREISKLLSSARASALKDGAEAVHSTIDWLEKKDVLRVILRSHLHHKQYVDQVKIIMKFLLQERRLSEEHLDAIWAATEKPDQFEAVKSNIFELLADLAWSFSDMQLDSLFNRFERSKDRPSDDVLKVLQLIKKLARSDTRGVMAHKLLELLWNMLLSGEAQGEILESNSFVEILQYYDSVKRADKQVYIKRCLSSIEKGQAVLPCLSLLTSIFLQDDTNVALQGQSQHSPRVQHINELEKQHGMVSLVAKSLEVYMAHARSLAPELLEGANGSKPAPVDGQKTHEEQIMSRLNFMFFILNWSQHDLSWDVAELIWECLVVKGACKSDADRAMTWLHRLLSKGSAVLISAEAQSKLLLQKMSQIDPADLSMIGYQCFQQLFQRVNVIEKKLVIESECLLTAELDLSGLQILWNIALLSKEEAIATLAIDSLRMLFLHLSSGLQSRTLEIRNSFTSEVFRRLEGTLAAAGGPTFVRPPDAVQLSEAFETTAPSKAPEKMDEDGANAADTSADASADASADVSMTPAEAPSTGEAGGSEALQAERCLRLLQVFIDSCESRRMKRTPVHGAFFKGLPLDLEVSPVTLITTIKNQRGVISSHTNEYIGNLRSRIAVKMSQTPARIRLLSRGRELVHDARLARQENLVMGAHIQVAPRMQDDRPLPFEEEELPGVVLSKKEEVYEVLFKLCGSNAAKVREGAQEVLQLLPTHPGILADLYWILEAKTADEVHDLLDQLFGAKERLLYTLQVLDGVLQPANRKLDSRAFTMRQKLLDFRCESYLTGVFGADALPTNLDAAARKSLYMSALRILRQLLIVHKTTPNIPTEELDADARAGALKRAEERARVRAGAPRTREVKPAGINDVPDLVVKMMRLTWAMAVGQPAFVASDAPFDSFPAPPPQEPETEESQWAPPDAEEFICKDGLDLLQKAIATSEESSAAFYQSPNFARFAVDIVLRAPNPYIRHEGGTFLYGSIHDSTNVAKQLHAMINARALADTLPRQSKEFWNLFCRLLLKWPDQEVSVQLLKEELVWLQNAPAVMDEDEDEGLEGHLNVLRTLVKAFPRYRLLGLPLGKPQGHALCEKLIKQFLFPEAVLLQGDDLETPRSATGASKPLEELVLQEAKCGTQKSRQAAFSLLEELAHDYLPNFLVIKDLLLRLHFRTDLHDWEAAPSYSRKTVGNFVGLKNAGATCYMNSVFQQLYMQPQVRRTILAADECEDLERKDSVFYQLQAMFGALLASSLDHYTPQGFWAAYRDIDGQPINLREHQDAFEFFNVLFDQVDEKLKAKGHKPTLTEIFGGTFAQQVICRGCPHRSEREEAFNALGVEVKGKRDLQEALESFVKGDLLEADNAYDCAICNKKVDALKRVCVKTLPHALIVHLKRFDFDYETMQRLKVKDRFVFPMHLDMHPYTVEGLAASENNASTSEDNDGASTVVMRPDAYYQYDLVGVVVHSGTAFAGHYYSYIKERDGDKPFGNKDPNAHGWMVFDDKRVEPYNVADLEKDCFGGKFVPEAYDNGLKPMQEFDRPNSAYMLLYERSTPVEVSEQSSPEASPSTAADGDAVAEVEPKGDLKKQLEDAVSKTSPGSARRGSVHMPPSIHRIVWQENLQSVSESHLLDSDYFSFLLQLATSCLQTYEKRLRGAEQGQEEGVQIAKASAELFIEFLMRVYLRSHKDLRTDLRQWKAVIMTFLQNSAHFTHHFLLRLLDNQEWLREGLLSCNSDEVRTVIGDWVVMAMTAAAEYNKGRKEDPMRLGLFLDMLAHIVKDCGRLKAYVKELIDILTAYAKIGTRQKMELLQEKHVFLPQLAFNALQDKITAFNSEEWEALVRCFAELLPCYDLTPICKQGTATKAATDKSLGQLNPYKAPDSPLVPLTDHMLDWVIYREELWQLMFEKCHQMPELVQLMQFCSWENPKFTAQLLGRLLNFIADALSRDCHMMPTILARILEIKDSYQRTRHMLLFDGDNKTESLTDQILDGETQETKRRWLIQLVLSLHRLSPLVGRTIRQNRLNGEDGWVHILSYMESRWLPTANENQRLHAEQTIEGVKAMLTPPTKKEVAARAAS